MRVKYFAQEHNAVPWTRLKARSLDRESSTQTARPLCLLVQVTRSFEKFSGQELSRIPLSMYFHAAISIKFEVLCWFE